MNLHRQKKLFLGRLELYLSRTKADLERDDYTQALANCGELSEISRRLWLHIEAVAKAERPR